MEYSTKSQSYTYDERVAAAQDILPLVEGNQVLLVDDLVPGERNNPVWCTYGTCPNCSYLIHRDGIIHTTQDWFDAGEMERAITDLFTVK